MSHHHTSRHNPHIGDTVVYEYCDHKGRWRWGLGVVIAFPGPSAVKLSVWQREDVQQLIHQREQEINRLSRSGRRSGGSPVSSPFKGSLSTSWGTGTLMAFGASAQVDVEDQIDYEVLNAAFDTTWVETDTELSTLIKSLICNLGAISTTPRTSRGTTEGPETVDDAELNVFDLQPAPLAVKTIQLSEEAATIIEKAVAKASEWTTTAVPASLVISPRQSLKHTRTGSDDSSGSNSYGSCIGDTIAETANPFKAKLNLGQTAQPMFRLNLPVSDATADEGYIALPPPSARKDDDSLGGTYNDLADSEDVDVQKLRSKMKEYEEQIESLIEQVETLRGSRASMGNTEMMGATSSTTSGNSNAATAGSGSGTLGVPPGMAPTATPRAASGTAHLGASSPMDIANVRPRTVRFHPEGSEGSQQAEAGPADPQAIVLLKKQLKEQRLNYDRQVSDLRLKNEEQAALINAWKVVVESAKAGIVGADGMKTARMNIHTARGNIQTARQQYRMTARNRSARENADAEAQLEAAEGMLDLQESVRQFITQTHDTVEVVEIGGGGVTPRGGLEPLRTARLRVGSTSPAMGSGSGPGNSPTAGSKFQVTNTAKPPGQAVVMPPATRPPTGANGGSTSPVSNSSGPPSVPAVRGGAPTVKPLHADPMAPVPTSPPTTPTDAATPLHGRSRKGLGAKAKPKMVGSTDLHSQFQNCCNLLRESAMTAELEASEERQRNAENGQKIRAMVEELEGMKKMREQEQALLRTQLERLEKGRPRCEHVGVQVKM